VEEDKATTQPTEETVEKPIDGASSLNGEMKEMGSAGAATANKKSKAPPAKGSRSSTRERKSIETYAPPSAETPKKFEIPDGEGEKLGDLPNVVSNFKGVTLSSDVIKDLHNVVFGGGKGKKRALKNNLLEFSGLVYTEDGEEKEKEKVKVLERMYKLNLDGLKSVMDLADVNRAKLTDKDSLCNTFLAWLEKPTASGKEAKSAPKKKRKSSGSSKKAPAKKAKSSSSNTAEKKKSKKAESSKKAPAKKAKSSSSNAAEKKKSKKTKSAGEVDDLGIPGVTREQLTEKIRSMIASADHGSVTVKDIRAQLEDFLDMDLEPFKDEIRGIVMNVLS